MSGDTEPLERIEMYARKSAARVRDLFNREPNGLPVLLPIHLRAADAAGSTAEMHYSVLVKTSKESVLQRYEQRQQRAAEEEAKRQAERDRRRRRMENLRNSSEEKDEQLLLERINALEQQMTRLEAQVEGLTRRLREREETQPEESVE